MIDVRRYDHKEATNKRTGAVTLPWYECYYYYNRKELAWYDSREDILRLNSNYLSKDKATEYERALKSERFSGAYKYLFDMLNADKETNMSEYMNI